MKLDRAEVLRNLGWRGQDLDAALEEKLDEGIRAVEGAVSPRFVTAKFGLEPCPGGFRVKGTELLLTGEDARGLLSGCHACFLLCATVGCEADRCVAQLSARSRTLGLIADACASAAVEALCDRIQGELAAREEGEGRYLTFRFAPGYGDLPLSLQPALLRVLDAGRRAGVTCGSGLLLSPAKSVTALMGVTREPRPLGSKCSRCPQYSRCAYRKEGCCET